MIKYPDVHVHLSGTDSNAMSIVATVSRSLRRAHIPSREIEKFQHEALNGDYNNVIVTCMRWVDVS